VNQIIISAKELSNTYFTRITVSAPEKFAFEQLHNKIRLSEIAHNIKSIAGIVDAPNPSIGLWVYRTDMDSVVFDEREITILQSIRPYLLLAIKAVTSQEERST